MKANLYINLGNTNAIFAFSEKNNINNLKVTKIKSKTIINDETNLKNIFNKINKKIQIKKIYISSVNNQLGEKLKKYLEENEYKYKFLSYKDTKFLDLSKLYNPYELGNDILSQLCYVSSFFEEAIVVSLGTASVIYHLKNNKLSGVVILPGISQSLNNLTTKTDIQNVEIIDTKNKLGLNTSESISIGLLHSIENQIKCIKNDLKTNCPIICTGGDMKYFSNKKWWFIENLEILGLFTLIEKKK
ncbi:type III pantothenate kinase [Mesomycoplasma moatsii]|uniref:type III pantothenate kinase n=1 Tax=Mesomycoplasma moatsii TaxID=171287 RepID=UPI0003B48B6B